MSKAVFLYQAAIVGSVWWLTLGQGFVGYLLALIFWAAFTFFRAMTPKLKVIQGAVILASAAVFAEAAYIDLLLTVEKHGIFVVVGLSFVATVVLTLAFNWLSGVVYANMAKRIDDVHDFAESPRFSYENVKEVVKSGTLSACGISDVLDTRAPVYLKVPFEEKDEARELGAKWDPSRREWYVPPGMDIREFERWMKFKEERKVMKESLTASSAFQLLIQSCADAIDSRSQGEEAGIIQPWMNKDEAIAIVLAFMVRNKYEQKFSPIIMTSLLIRYCRNDILDAFVRFFCNLSVVNETCDMSPERLKNGQYDVLMDIEELAITGRNLGWKQSWCPFRDHYAEQWNKAFSL